MNINELDLKGLLESIKKEKQIQYNKNDIEKIVVSLEEKDNTIQKEEIDIDSKEFVSKNKEEIFLENKEDVISKNEINIVEKEDDKSKREIEIPTGFRETEKKPINISKTEEEINKKEIKIEEVDGKTYKTELPIKFSFTSAEKQNVDIDNYRDETKEKVFKDIEPETDFVQKAEKDIEPETVFIQKAEKDIEPETDFVQKVEKDIEPETELSEKIFKDIEPEFDFEEKRITALKKGNDNFTSSDIGLKEKDTTALKKGNDNFTSNETELTEKSAVVPKVGIEAYDPYDDLTRQSRFEETESQLWENKTGRATVSIKTGTLGNFSFFSWKDIEHGASYLLNKVGKNGKGYHPVGSVRQLLSNTVEGALMIKHENFDPFKIATLAVNSVGLFLQTSNINRGRYDLTPRDEYQGLSEKKKPGNTGFVYKKDGNLEVPFDPENEKFKEKQPAETEKVRVNTVDGFYEEDPEPKTTKSKPTDKQVGLKKGEGVFEENTSFEEKQPGNTGFVYKKDGNLEVPFDPENEKFEEKSSVDTKKVKVNTSDGSYEKDPEPIILKSKPTDKQVGLKKGERVFEGNDSFEEKQPGNTGFVYKKDGNLEELFDPENEKFEEKSEEFINLKGEKFQDLEIESVEKTSKKPKDIDFKLSGELDLSNKRMIEKRLTENMSSIGYIYVSPVNIDHLKGVNFIKIPLQSNLVSNSDTRRATYISTDFISRIGSVKQYVSTESVSYSLETKYFVSSNVSGTNGFTMEDLQKIESMYKSLVYPRYINQTSTESGMNESFYTRPPIINIVIGEHDNKTYPYTTEDAPSASSNDSAGVINNFFTNVYSTKFNEKKVTYKYFIVTEVSIEKDYEKTPFYLESKKSESGEITVSSPKDLMGFDVKLTITEIDPNYFGVLPSFNDYASFGTLGQGAAFKQTEAGEVFGEVAINNETYRDNTPV